MLNSKDFEVIMRDNIESGNTVYRDGAKGEFKKISEDMNFTPSENFKFHGSKDLRDDYEINRFGANKEDRRDDINNFSAVLKVPKYLKVFYAMMELADDHCIVNITQQELADILKYSRATVNVYIKYLKENKFIMETDRQGRYILVPKAIIRCVRDLYVLTLYDRLHTIKDEVDEEAPTAFEFKLRYYIMVKNLGFEWVEFEEKYSEELKELQRLKMGMSGALCGCKDEEEKVFGALKEVEKRSQENNKGNNYTYCTYCRNKVGKDWIYCSKCGHKIERVEDLEEREENIKVFENEMSKEEKCLTSDLSHLVNLANSVESIDNENIEYSEAEEMSASEKNLTDDILTLIDKANNVEEEDVLTEKEKRLICLVATMVRKQVEYEYESKSKSK